MSYEKEKRPQSYRQSAKVERIVVKSGTTSAKRARIENQYRSGDGAAECAARRTAYRPLAASLRVSQRHGDNCLHDDSISPASRLQIDAQTQLRTFIAAEPATLSSRNDTIHRRTIKMASLYFYDNFGKCDPNLI